VFDHERQSVYNFQVVATDGGRYDARSQKVPVQITIGDVNDNKPMFSRFPFSAEIPAYSQPGHNLLRVTAEDKDEGTNAEIVFTFVNEPSNNKFRINPNTGIVTAASSLAMESGKLFHLEVLARDKGNPPQSATGLIEIKVGESPDGAATLRFQNTSYVVHLSENAPIGMEVVQVRSHNFLPHMYTWVYPKVSGLTAWRSENCKWFSSLPLGAVVSLFCDSC
jgi:protocadherin-16/23